MAKAAWWLLRQFCGTRKILVGFAVFLNRFFISEPTAHTVVFFYFKFHFFFFLRENVDTGLHPLKAAQIYVEKNLCLKKTPKTHNKHRSFQ